MKPYSRHGNFTFWDCSVRVDADALGELGSLFNSYVELTLKERRVAYLV